MQPGMFSPYAFFAPADYSRKAEAIAGALGLPSAHMALLVRQQPALAAMPLDALASKATAFSQRLALPVRQALTMIARQPLLMAADVDGLLASCEALGAALGLPTEQVSAI